MLFLCIFYDGIEGATNLQSNNKKKFKQINYAHNYKLIMRFQRQRFISCNFKTACSIMMKLCNHKKGMSCYPLLSVGHDALSCPTPHLLDIPYWWEGGGGEGS